MWKKNRKRLIKIYVFSRERGCAYAERYACKNTRKEKKQCTNFTRRIEINSGRDYEIGGFIEAEIYGVNFVDSPVETVLILHLHMYPYIIFPARVLHWETSLAKSTHACSNIRTNCSRTFSILSRGEELKTWLLKRVITRLKLYFSIIYFFSFIKLHYLIKYYYRNSWTKVDRNYSNL